MTHQRKSRLNRNGKRIRSLPPEGEPDLCHAAVLLEHLNREDGNA